MIARVEPLTLTRAVRGPFDYLLRRDQERVEVGSLLRVPFGGRRVVGVVVGVAEHSELAPERLVEPEAVLHSSLPADLVSLAQWMADEYCSTLARALGLVLAPGAARGIGRRPRAPSPRPAGHEIGPVSAATPPLTVDQQRALERIVSALCEGRSGQRILLHGVTGSGKTEVYLQAAQAALATGRSAIVLVPEIALTPQALRRFEARFGDVVAVLHSALGVRERHDEWQRLSAGEARVCVGPRSAVFAPLHKIGLIVVDEEHEGSYKHEGDPRYDARTVAEFRARQHGAMLVLGSATPRPESVLSMSIVRLPSRIDGRPLPPVEVLDMRGLHHPLHPDTRLALADLRRSQGKAIVLLNRRGWSNFLGCRACGQVWMCPNCEVALVLHRAGGFVACHHCGHREPARGRCDACGSVSVARHGAGTERLEHELRAALGGDDFPVFRLDADSARLSARAHTLERFQAARAGVLVGTQMVAKGHDFPDVGLGVVLDADQTLRFPDFRADERTFALVTQLAGRAGRGGEAAPSGAHPGRPLAASGRVLVQTLAPDARAIRYAARHDADGFLAGELERRKALRYPPFSSLIRIVCSAVEPADAQARAAELRERIVLPGATVLGPAPLFALRGRARRQLVVKAADRAGAIRAVGAAVDGIARSARKRAVNISVDVDPR